jgi:hypothetical protein
VKVDNSKARFDANLEAYIQFKGCRNTMIFVDGGNAGAFKAKYFLKDSPTKLKTILQDFSSVLDMALFRISHQNDQ